MLTRTSGVLAISEMLAVGACCAKAAADCIITAEQAATFKNLPIPTKPSLEMAGPSPSHHEAT
jgi:hypothetical protein